jgi:hypothetical protein
VGEGGAIPMVADLVGDVFEILVKRGVIGCLLDAALLDPRHPCLAAWNELRFGQLAEHLLRQADVTDPTYEQAVVSVVDHMAVAAYGLGWTCMREYLRHRGHFEERGRLDIDGLWSPLELKDRTHDRRKRDAETLSAYWSAMQLPGEPRRRCMERGAPARADFAMTTQSARGERNLVVLEFSLNVAPEPSDFRREIAHLEELEAFVRRVERRGVFSRVSAEVTGEGFQLSQGLIGYLPAFTSGDKPLFKLCQGSSYATATDLLLRLLGKVEGKHHLQVLAVTATGVEGLSATTAPGPASARGELMKTLGKAYRKLSHTPDDSANAYDEEILFAYDEIRRSLPRALQDGIAAVLDQAKCGRSAVGRVSERVEGFLNPNDRVAAADVGHWFAEDPGLDEFFGTNAHALLLGTVQALSAGGVTTLRTLHEAAIRAGFEAAPRGRVTVLGLEGNPGIGKTTAVLNAIKAEDQGTLFLYLSPRVVINAGVVDPFIETGAKPGEVLAVTTNSVLIRGAASYYRKLVERNAAPAGRKVDAAVVAYGDGEFVRPAGSIYTLTHDEAAEVDQDYGVAGLWREEIDARRAKIRDTKRPGVLATLGRYAREVLESNRSIRRLALTGAIQGYKQADTGTSTLRALTNLFRYAADTPSGVRERRAFAARMSKIVVMVDELAGDGAGSPLVHALAAWLHEQFIDPFLESPAGSPFAVLLIVADASLANDVVLERYLAHEREAPDKVLVSPGVEGRPIRLAAGRLALGGRSPRALHVMTDSFPARMLTIEYAIRLMPIDASARGDAGDRAPRAAIRTVANDLLLQSAEDEVRCAIGRGEPQVILFAQDKAFLGDLQRRLAAGVEGLDRHNVQVLDSSVPPARRRDLVSPKIRDRVRVFLMTSSGARGVSFPRTTTIIAFVPRFSIESGLMEIAQLIYRGRGSYKDPETGGEVSGDDADRRLVFVVNDFVIGDDGAPDRRQWLRQSVDLATLVTLLRASVLTRVKGESGIRGRSLSVVPIGHIGIEEMVEPMSRALAELTRELTVYMSRGEDRDIKGLITETQGAVMAHFRGVRVDGLLPRERATFARDELLDRLDEVLTAPNLSLLQAALEAKVPERVYCVGPLWMERWDDATITEAFLFDSWNNATEHKRNELGAMLWHLSEDRALPPSLRRPATTLHKILVRERSEMKRQYSTEKPLETRRAWLVLPVDHVRFTRTWRCGEEEPQQDFRLEHAGEWLDLLVRAVTALKMPTAFLPVVPEFQGKPWLLIVSPSDPTDMLRVFDDQYFMASSELNVLNTLLTEIP